MDLHLDCLQTIKSKETEKKTTSNVKHKELVETNKKVAKLICKKIFQDGVKIFSKLTHPQLESFILAHNAIITSKSQLPSMGSLKDTKNNTVRNRI